MIDVMNNVLCKKDCDRFDPETGRQTFYQGHLYSYELINGVYKIYDGSYHDWMFPNSPKFLSHFNTPEETLVILKVISRKSKIDKILNDE